MENPFEIKETTNIGIVEESTDTTNIEQTFVQQTQVVETPPQNVVEENLETPAAPPTGDTAPPVEKQDEGAEGADDDSEKDFRVNAYHAALLHLRDEGFAEEDQIKQNATWEDVEPLFEAKVRDKVESQVAKRLEAQGLNEETIMYAKMIHNNQGIEEAKEIHLMGRIAALRQVPDLTEDQKKAVVSNMYKLRDYKPDEIGVIIEDKIKQGEFDTLYEGALKFHEDKYTSLKTAEYNAIKQKEEELARFQAQQQLNLEKMLKERKIMDRSFSKQVADNLVKDIYTQNTEYEYQGKKMVGSKVDAFFAKFFQSDEHRLLTYLIFEYPDEFERVTKAKAKQDIEKEILAANKTKDIKKSKTEVEDTSISWYAAQ